PIGHRPAPCGSDLGRDGFGNVQRRRRSRASALPHGSHPRPIGHRPAPCGSALGREGFGAVPRRRHSRASALPRGSHPRPIGHRPAPCGSDLGRDGFGNAPRRRHSRSAPGRMSGSPRLRDTRTDPMHNAGMSRSGSETAPKPSRADSRPSLRERFDAMRNIPPFLRQIWATSPALGLTSIGLRVVRAFLPILTLYVGKLIIDEAIRLVGLGLAFDSVGEAWRSGQLDPLMWLLVIEFGLAIASDLLGRIVSYADSLLSELFTNATSVRLMEHAATLDLEDFEDPDVQDKLDRARRQTMGRMNLMGQLFGQVQDAITVVSFAVGLLVYAPWLIVLLA